MPTVIVLAKAPVPGRVKTRLCPPLSPVEAAALQRACLIDFWRRLSELSGVRRVLCYDPPDSLGLFQELLGEEVEALAQSDGGLGTRLSTAFAALFATGARPILAVGADSPDLPLSHLRQAIRHLEESCDLVIGPALDGGYTSIGMSRLQQAPFEAIPWSTGEVTKITLERCREANLRACLLPSWYDVDDAGGLERLRAAVTSNPPSFPQLTRFFHQIRRPKPIVVRDRVQRR